MIQKTIFLLLAIGAFVCSMPNLAHAGGVDVNDDGVVNTEDLEYVDKHIGRTGPHAADVNDDNIVNITDLVLVKNAIGTASAPTDMVLIPAGNFQMGSNDPEADNDEQPVHTVYVDAFYMDKYEVTNAQYAAFLNVEGKHVENGIVWFDLDRSLTQGYTRIERVGGRYRAKAEYADHPVDYVTWYGAMAYALWAGKRLPTEAEWEKAARGGLVGQKYPWGNSIKADYDAGLGRMTRVGSYPPNGYGLYDMTGNVWEWCLDAYQWNFYVNSPRQNPIAGAARLNDILDNYTSVNTARVLRGGLRFGHPVRVADRGRTVPSVTSYKHGFRCARTVTP